MRLKKVLSVLLVIAIMLSAMLSLTQTVSATDASWAFQVSRTADAQIIDYSDYDWSALGENLIPDPTVSHFDAGENSDQYGRYAKVDGDYNPVAVNPYYWWDKYIDREYGFTRYIDDLVIGGNLDLSSLTKDTDGYYELVPGTSYSKPSRDPLTFSPSTRSPMNWAAPKKASEYASLTDDDTGVLRFSSSGAWRALPLPSMEANKYYVVKFNMKSADSKNGSLELCLQFENGNGDLGENAAAVTLGTGLTNARTDVICFVVYTGSKAYVDPFIKFYCQTETFFDDFGIYKVSEKYVMKQAEGVKLTDPPVYASPVAFQVTREEHGEGPVIDYSDFDWSTFGENFVPDPTVDHFDAGPEGNQYGRYAKIDANYNPVEANPYYWWDKASDPANGFTSYYSDLAEHDKFDLNSLPRDENGYYELEVGKCYGAAVRHADQGNKYLLNGVEYDPMFRSNLNWVNGLTKGVYPSLTDDGSGVLHYTGAAAGSRRYFALPKMEAESYYVVKFDVKCITENLYNIDLFLLNRTEDEPDATFSMSAFGTDNVYTVAFLVYTGSKEYTDPFIRVYLMDSEVLFDNFGVYKVSKEYALLCSEGTKLYRDSVAGDVNGDGTLNNKDLTRLFQYLSDWEVEVNEAALDINGDGSVNNKDLTRLFQYLSNWDVKIFCNSTNAIPEETSWSFETPAQRKMRENEEYFYNYGSDIAEPTEELVSASVTSAGMLNALKRAKQLIELTWTPTADTMPGFFNKDSKQEYFNYIEGKEYKGIPYSSVYETNTYVGSNCSIETYISAICNPNSYVYTKNLRGICSEPKAVTYYGMVCSKFVAYALGITETYNTKHFGDIPGMNLIASARRINVNDILPADVLNNPGSHTAIVTDVLRDTSGNVKYIEVSEETTAVRMRCRKWSVIDFLSHFGRYNLLRYEYLDSVEYKKSDFVNIFDENAQLDDRKYDVLTRYGDKCNIDFSSAESRTVTLDILTDSWQEAVVYFGDTPVSNINIRNKKSFSFTPDNPGYYKVELKNGDKTSRPCRFCMYDAVLNVNSVGGNSFDVSYSSQTGKAVWFQVGGIADSVYKKSNASGNEMVTYTETISNKIIRVAFENEYGVYVSNYKNG